MSLIREARRAVVRFILERPLLQCAEGMTGDD